MSTTAVVLDPRLPPQDGLRAEADAVRAVVLAERTAKDLGQWDVMAAAFATDAEVAVSWYQGSGAGFVAGARARSDRGDSPSFHEIGAIAVVVNGDRALADASCAVHVQGRLGGVLVDVVSRGRLCWRVARTAGRWRIAGLDMIYLRDTAFPVHPGDATASDAGRGHRASYRNLAALLQEAGRSISNGLPGVDRPDLVEALLASHRRWFFT